MIRILFATIICLVFLIGGVRGQYWRLAGNSDATANSVLGTTNAQPLRIFTNYVQRLTIGATGNIGIGITTPPNLFSIKPRLASDPGGTWLRSSTLISAFAEGDSAEMVVGSATGNAASGAIISARRSRGLLSNPQAVQTNDVLFTLNAGGFDGSAFVSSAFIRIAVDGAVTAGSVPQKIAFYTGPGNSQSAERMSIAANGNIQFNTSQFFIQRASGAIGIANSARHATSILDIRSSSKGVLIPRLTRSQRNNISSPAEGLLIYQVDNEPGFYYYRAGWNSVGISGANSSLSNLQNTRINTHLVPDAGNFRLGTPERPWSDLYIRGAIYINGSRAFRMFQTDNFAIGRYAGDNLAQAASDNFLAGHMAGRYTTTGMNNIAIGRSALYNNETGSGNIALGYNALNGVYGGYWNTAVGITAGYNLNAPEYCTFVGASASATSNFTNATALGYNARALTSNQVMLGNIFVTTVRAAANHTIYSDERFKNAVEDNVPGLSFINKLRPVTYRYNIRKLNQHIHNGQSAPGQDNLATNPSMKAKEEEMIANKEKIVYSGFLAQEVEKVIRELNYDFSGLYKPQSENDVYGISYADFVVPLVKSVQELSRQNEELRQEVAELKNMLLDLANGSNFPIHSQGWMKQNIPNPVTTNTAIQYFIASDVRSARILITDAKGSQVKIYNVQGAGTVNFARGNLPSGTYTYSLICDGKTVSAKKMIIAR